MININEMLRQAYPNSTHGKKGISPSMLKSMGDVRFSRPFENKCALDEYMIDMTDEKGDRVIPKPKQPYLLGQAIENWLVGKTFVPKMQPAYAEKFGKISNRLLKYHTPVFDMLQHVHTLHNPFYQADFMVETDAGRLTAKLCGEMDFVVPSEIVNRYLPDLLPQYGTHGRVLIELKSTSSMKYWYSDIDRYQYLVQLAIYKHLLAENVLPVDEVIILFVDTANPGNLKFVSIPERGIGTDLIEAKLLQLYAALNAAPVYTPDHYRLRDEQGATVDEVDDGMFDLSDLDYGVE
jgi:CRISPR/Cas system-associated exonuclease Cas4 (RecB family)